MAYGLADVVQQGSFIAGSDGSAEHKRVDQIKLDALLGYAEAAGCRRQVLLNYFGEPSTPCGNCDTCLTPPELWDATIASQKALSAVIRTGQRFGAGHVIDVLHGKHIQKSDAALQKYTCSLESHTALSCGVCHCPKHKFAGELRIRLTSCNIIAP